MNKAKIKSLMPKEPITIEVPIKLTLIRDFDKYSNGSMLMKLSDTAILMTNTETQEPIGEIGMAMGGTFYVEVGEACYALKLKDMSDLFSKVQEAAGE